MAPKRRRQPQAVNLLELRDEVDAIASRVDNANAMDWPAALLEDGEEHAKTVQKSVEQLRRAVGVLVKTVTQKKRLLRSQQTETDGYYPGRVKIGLAQLKQQTVPTISRICSDFKQCSSLGYFVASVGKDVLRDIDVQKISGSSIKVPRASQSKSVYLSPRSKQDKLHGLACFSLIAHDNQTGKGKRSEFNVPDLSWRGDRLDPRELLCSTVQNAREDDEQPYLVIPTESSPHWLESIGVSPYLLDCGEQLKKTARPIPGVHTSYLYISGSRKSSSPLHVEDAFLGSINLVLAGAPKVWLMVEPRFRAKLEERVRQHLVETDLESEEEGEYDEEDNEDQDDEGGDHRGEDDQDNDQDDDLQYDGPCSQFVRHQSSLLSPKLLDSWGIPYRIVVCEAGQMMVTLPGAYHEVVNAGPNMAMAINFAPSGWTESRHLFIACNVEARSLHCNWTDSGDHWILIIVDFDKAKVHVLGDEEGHKAEAEAIAYNISLFVNNYRRMNRVDAVDWSSLETHPVR
ncbi:Aspartyl beta-hydroxylase [Neofusicoccum parvum]|uniref:Aspartyl beta-hydroxylase, partial n=1 Tax=Neofusicoccum parvum TaxID=310453 RepID=A0ACB5SE67_9PEZI|nr:Aspartyl beta-hydroxylase [Neofusicoccum parvum]